jgi:hypothetical protein
MDDGWKQVWAEMTDAELEDHLFTYLWLSLHTINPHAGRVARLIQEAERRGKPEIVERARMKAEATPVAKLGGFGGCPEKRHPSGLVSCTRHSLVLCHSVPVSKGGP